MCFTEFIAYQCGHRSSDIMRPCAVTTRRHNYPVCPNYPFKQHDAFTQCPVCERECHTRWVLIREAEHRWYHERGICGCGVVFPNLEAAPQVVGGGTSADRVMSIPGPIIDSQASGLADAGPSRTAGKAPAVPPLFTEAVVGDKRRVAVRLTSQYAVEWVADHRKVHRSNPTHCDISLDPIRPLVDERDMTTAERGLLQRCREVEPKNMNSPYDVDEIESAMGKVGDIFGASTCYSFTPSQSPVYTPPSPSLSLASALTGGRWPYVQRSHNYQVETLQHALHEDVYVASSTSEPLPVCGLPLGAGPEGPESYMPSFYNCRLRQAMPKRRMSLP